jgi:DNA-binding GntR family transcriptional regulator
LADRVWKRLSEEIIRGDLAPGTRLVELDVAERMGTSQGPVREALQRLERDGLVHRRARSASYVTPLVPEEIFELFAIRTTVERFAIRRTARLITPAQCDELQQLIGAMHEAVRRNDIMDLVNFDMEFHRRICEWSTNAMLLRVWLPLFFQIQRFIVHTHPHYFTDLAEIAETHQPIVDALRGGQISVVEFRIEEHIMLVWSRINRAK